ncbi:MAG: hypothetical protein IKI08_05030 [Selenomonadaceae bacterium]|nr:hypothetical protein [Selenomonadaceae bacterium]
MACCSAATTLNPVKKYRGYYNRKEYATTYYRKQRRRTLSKKIILRNPFGLWRIFYS